MNIKKTLDEYLGPMPTDKEELKKIREAAFVSWDGVPIMMYHNKESCYVDNDNDIVNCKTGEVVGRI